MERERPRIPFDLNSPSRETVALEKVKQDQEQLAKTRDFEAKLRDALVETKEKVLKQTYEEKLLGAEKRILELTRSHDEKVQTLEASVSELRREVDFCTEELKQRDRSINGLENADQENKDKCQRLLKELDDFKQETDQLRKEAEIGAKRLEDLQVSLSQAQAAQKSLEGALVESRREADFNRTRHEQQFLAIRKEVDIKDRKAEENNATILSLEALQAEQVEEVKHLEGCLAESRREADLNREHYEQQLGLLRKDIELRERKSLEMQSLMLALERGQGGYMEKVKHLEGALAEARRETDYNREYLDQQLLLSREELQLKDRRLVEMQNTMLTLERVDKERLKWQRLCVLLAGDVISTCSTATKVSKLMSIGERERVRQLKEEDPLSELLRGFASLNSQRQGYSDGYTPPPNYRRDVHDSWKESEEKAKSGVVVEKACLLRAYMRSKKALDRARRHSARDDHSHSPPGPRSDFA